MQINIGGLMSGGLMSGGRMSGGRLSGGLMSAHHKFYMVSTFPNSIQILGVQLSRIFVKFTNCLFTNIV